VESAGVAAGDAASGGQYCQLDTQVTADAVGLSAVTIVAVAFWLSCGVVVYVYAGYPLLLVALTRVRGRSVAIGTLTPSVSMIVSAYNEARVIGEKIENALAMDYPRELFELIVVSDASDDRTDEIVRRYEARGVRLLRMAARAGKSAGLNTAVPACRGEVIVFSDANAMYDKTALRMIVRNFSDSGVGAVTGETRYAPAGGDAATRNESLYWRYEQWIKRLESRAGSLVGGDGALYAIRKALYNPLRPDDLSDFVNPLQIVMHGYRNIYEPDAFSVEDGAGSFAREYRRKVRIVNRAWRAMMRNRKVLNPFKYGVFAWECLSHKVLRWLVPVWLTAGLLLNIALIGSGPIFTITLAVQGAFYFLGACGAWLARRGRDGGVALVPYYFCMVNFASAHGIVDYLRGETYTTWTTPRATGGA
jgi:cellulose synthase/poly-beta-1,6-N-acetylglucosamine synthase-like glycosyltransferase